MLEKISHSKRRDYQKDTHQLKILYPGHAINSEDSGIGTIGRIDHAVLKPGASIPFHEHRDDEILSYVRKGQMIHQDNLGKERTVDGRHFMMMNSGTEIEHQESVPDNRTDEEVEMLQIFFRPYRTGLNPAIQFFEAPDFESVNEWRLLAGPDENAPLKVRSASKFYDIKLKAGEHTSLPAQMQFDQLTFLLYVFSGSIALNDHYLSLVKGDSLVIREEKPNFLAKEDSEVVLFVTNENSDYTTEGAYSGKKMAPEAS